MSTNEPDDDSSDAECPTCGRDDFASLAGMKRHHLYTHDESIAGTDLTCKQCGGTYQEAPHREDRSNFCSMECYAKWQSENKVGENSPTWKDNKVEVSCGWCGEVKTVLPSYKKKHNRHFCDGECYAEWQSEYRSGENSHEWRGGGIEVPCEWCGEPKVVRVSYAEKYNHQFCDKDCYDAWQSENLVGEKHPTWKGGYDGYYGPDWDEKCRKVRERDGKQCQSCGMEQTKHVQNRGMKLPVHHIVPARKFDEFEKQNAMGNLVTLCVLCHKKWEGVPVRPTLVAGGS